MKTLFLITFAVLAISGIGLVIFGFLGTGNEFVIDWSTLQGRAALLKDVVVRERVEEEPASKITVFAVGDIMLDRGVEYVIERDARGDFTFPFRKIANDLKKADILFGNLESIVASRGSKIGSIHSFRADPKAIEGLVYAGFDVLSVANNHTLDYGRAGMEDSIRKLQEAGITFVGAGLNANEAFSVKIKEVRGTKIGFLAFTNLGPAVWRAGNNSPGIAWMEAGDREQIIKNIQEAKEAVDVLLVSFHWGQEYTSRPDAFQSSFGKALIDGGADIVIGHHPHVIQPVERYKSGWIAYSLGNFVFDQGFSEETMKGLLLEILIEDKKITEVNQQIIKISPSFQPYFSEE